MSVALKWDPEATGTPPFLYVIQESLHGANSWSTAGSSTTTHGVALGQVGGQSYDFRVYATHSSQAPTFADEMTSEPWMGHQVWQTGDQWSYCTTFATGGLQEGPTWWANPIATPSAAPVYAWAGGELTLGLIQNPGGNGITQTTLGTIINNQLASGGTQLYGYHEFSVAVAAVPGFLFHWDIEDYPLNANWTMELDIDIWTNSDGSKHVRFQDPVTHPNVAIYETTAIDITQQHTYGVNWQSDFLTFFIDGTQVAQAPNPGGDYRTQSAFTYFLTSDASYAPQGTAVGSAVVPSSLGSGAVAQLKYYRQYSNKPTFGPAGLPSALITVAAPNVPGSPTLVGLPSTVNSISFSITPPLTGGAIDAGGYQIYYTTGTLNGIYVLSGVNAAAVLAAPVYAKVVEGTSDGVGAFFSSTVVASMKKSGTVVLGYFDCGFCESFRPYYTTAQTAGIIINPGTPVFGSGASAEYSVQFWSATWLTISKNWILSLFNAGFDGVYLDVIDGWNYSGSANDPVVVAAGGLSQSANFMTAYIQNLRTYAHTLSSSFQIWVNGAEELFNPALAGYGFTVTVPYASVIDGMLKEQVLYPHGSTASGTNARNLEKSMLDNCKNAGKPVILVEYVTGTTDVTDVKNTCATWGYGYYIANPNQNLNGVDVEGWS